MSSVIVIGAGPGGLAVSAALRERGVDALVIDRAAQVGASWRAHYERLHLHTERALSALPGLEIPPEYGKWVARDHVVAYLEQYAKHHALRLQLGTEVTALEPGWTVKTQAGPLRADTVIVATGYNHTPFIPQWGSFAGELLHSAKYRNPAPYRGRDVLVAGVGNSGAEIAVDLVEGGAGRVRVAVRTPPNVVPREMLGLATQRMGVVLRHLPPGLVDAIGGGLIRAFVGDLTKHGLPRAPRGVYTRAREGQIPILDVGFVDALKKGRLEIVPAIESFAGRDVVLHGGARIQPDAVIAATGYKRGLERFAGALGVLDPQGLPKAHGATPAAPGLHFIGYTNPISGNLRELAIDARAIARAVVPTKGPTRRTSPP